MERYITDSLDDYHVGPCSNCGSTIGHADLERVEDWVKWLGGDSEVPLKWEARGKLTCACCEVSRAVAADVRSGSVRQVFSNMEVLQ